MMRRTLAILAGALLTAATATAQHKVYVCDKFSYDAIETTSANGITFSADGTTVYVEGKEYLTADIDSVTFAEPQFPTIKITYSGTTATVDVPSTITDVTYTVDGAHVTLTSGATAQEYLYTATGTSTNGSLTINGSYKLTLELNGLTLTSQKGAAIDVECGKRIDVILKEGTVNTLTDCTGGTQKAAFYTTGHPEFGGKGTLNVTGLTKHAIGAKEYLQFKKSTGTINILSAVSDGIHCGKGKQNDDNSHFQINGGTITINNAGSDCIDADDYGCMYINGGTLNLNVSATDGTGLKCDSIIRMTGGEININITGELSEGIRTYYAAYFDGGTISAKANANGSKCIKAKKSTKTTDTVVNGGFLYFNGTNATIEANGGTYTADNTKCMGIRADQDFTQTAGTITITTTNNAAVGLSVKGNKNLNGGTLQEN